MQSREYLFCTEHFKKIISDPERIDTNYVWDILHEGTGQFCEIPNCYHTGTWKINHIHNNEVLKDLVEMRGLKTKDFTDNLERLVKQDHLLTSRRTSLNV